MERLTMIIICLVVFAIQLLLCFRAKKTVVKLIPAALLLAALAVFLILVRTASGWDSLGYIAFVLLFAIALIPCAAGWVIWAVCFLIWKHRHSGESN